MQIGVRAMDTLEQLTVNLDVMTGQLESYEETVLWPAVVSKLLEQQQRLAEPLEPEAVIEAQFNQVVCTSGSWEER